MIFYGNISCHALVPDWKFKNNNKSIIIENNLVILKICLSPKRASKNIIKFFLSNVQVIINSESLSAVPEVRKRKLLNSCYKVNVTLT